MNELAEFFIAFNTQGLAQLNQSLADVNEKLDGMQGGFEKASSGSKDMESGLMSMTKKVAGLAAGFFGLQAIMNGVFSVNNEVLALNAMADAAGVAAENVESLAIATKKFGGSNESAAGVYQNLANMRTKISQGLISDDQKIAMARYGVSYSGKHGIASPDEMLENLARVMPKLSAGQRADLGQTMGLDKATILLLAKGLNETRAALKDASTKISLSGERQRLQAEQLSDSMTKLKSSWNEFLIGLTPLLTTIIDLLSPLVAVLGEVATAFGAGIDLLGVGLNKLTFGAVGMSADKYAEKYQSTADRWFGPNDEVMGAAKSSVTSTKSPLNSAGTYSPSSKFSKNEQSITIGNITIEDKSGDIKGKTGALKTELDNVLSSLELSPGLMAKSVR